jgi:hypothetical protein
LKKKDYRGVLEVRRTGEGTTRSKIPEETNIRNILDIFVKNRMGSRGGGGIITSIRLYIYLIEEESQYSIIRKEEVRGSGLRI